MAQEQDPFAKFRVNSQPDKSKDDPFAKFRTNIEPEIEEEPVRSPDQMNDLERTVLGLPPLEIPDEPSMLENVWNALTTSILPEYGDIGPNPEDKMVHSGFAKPFPKEPETYGQGFLKGIDEYLYDEIAKPTFSAGGAALTVFGGPIMRGALRVAKRIPGANAVGEILNKNIFGTTAKAAGSVIDDVIPEGSVLPEAKVNPVEGGLTTANTVERMPGGPNAGMYGIASNTGDQMFPSVPNRMQGPGTNQTVFDALIPSRTKEQIGQLQKLGEPELPAVKLRDNPNGTVSTVSNPVQQLDKVTGQPLPGPIDKLVAAVKTAKPLQGEQAQIYAAEKARRLRGMDEVESTGQKGFFERKGKLAGDYPKVQMEPLKLDQADVDSLYDSLRISGLDKFQTVRAGDGITKILSGQVPQRNELQLLKSVFGKQIDELETILPKVDAAKSKWSEAYNISRGMQTIWDLSIPFRQGLPQIHTKAWWNSWKPMVKSFGEEKSFRGVMDSILSHPNFKPVTLPDGSKEAPLFKRAGLRMMDLINPAAEEVLAPNVVERLIPGARASNRAAAAFLNKLRADNFNRLIDNARKAGKNPDEDIELARRIAGVVNDTSGGSSLGKLEKHAEILSNLLFSPRFVASRLQMLNPKNYVMGDRMVRAEYAKSAAALAGAWMTTMELGKLHPDAEVGTDTNSTDFGKIKFGNTRLDPGAGFQQWLVLMSRLSSGEYSTTTGNERSFGQGFGTNTKRDALIEFIINKLHPSLSFPARALNASSFRPFAVGDETVRAFTPMVIQDLSDILQDDPDLLPLMIPAAVGYGVQTQGERGEVNRLFGNEFSDITLEGNEGIGRMFGGNPFDTRMRQ